ncbi:enoyl-CoA hydratase/isomerase [Rhodococcus ruber BKS 20-38]|uniref:Enoyl-CoA hydratase/isomerase n=1 Tax=Rhodococcus ruber BKS 20-38 TaxID=1278076 RepID=M2YCM6_9NOCA|nr:enoyl-CoA hydratase-related protein [Rhodococcus ruber]EME52597.1 enoyl-CoA hydratase/isomerase [Rhodococcus ruber BKS 20-38]
MADCAAQLRRLEGPLLAEVTGHTLVVTLNRPEVANALDGELMRALSSLWSAASAAPDLRCIVLTGAGRAFCSGADVSMLATGRTALGDTAAEELAFVPGPRVPVPVIALVNGVCAGGGLHFVADADICIAGESARFLDPHVSVGQVSALEPLLMRGRVRRDVINRMVLLGRHEQVSAQDAHFAGLVSEVVRDDELVQRGTKLAEWISLNSPEAVRLSRRVMRLAEERSLATELDLGWELVRRHHRHPDSQEGPRAFLEKRPAEWVVGS